MRLAVRRALAEPRLREGAGRVAAWHREHDGPAVAALAVEEWAATPR
jgi:UDP:flavonoid glycosyltransferase YjiC (YdhE family)